ncbi:MAG: GNAT family acetyltransferase [Pseudomonadota bacterium]
MTFQLDLRPATQADASAVVDLWDACDLTADHNPPVPDFARAVAGAASDILVAERDGALLGSVMVGDDGHRAWVYYLAVAPAERHTGLGRALMQAAEDWADERGARKLQLMIRPSNESVRAFYAACGYGETPRLVMAKWIDKEVAAQPPHDRG